jgi:hypothetical protein
MSPWLPMGCPSVKMNLLTSRNLFKPLPGPGDPILNSKIANNLKFSEIQTIIYFPIFSYMENSR